MNTRHMVVLVIGFASVLAPGGQGHAQSMLVEPYLQQVTPTSLWILWETDRGDESHVSWGAGDDLDNEEVAPSRPTVADTRMHEVEVTGLLPDTVYSYRVSTDGGAIESAIHQFRTPPLASSEQGFRLVAMSDMQLDRSQPDKFREMVEDGVLDYFADQFGGAIFDELAMVLVPGDLVDDGQTYSEWADTFFGPGAALFSQVPVYPVLGNHEANTAYYFQYFHLPTVGDPLVDEHWWSMDYSNVRVIGLDSNGLYAIPRQLDYLSEILDETCDDDAIDFVFAQLHHPYKSELWLPGQLNFTGEVIARMEDFTDRCGKPTIHFFGHTHGYSRGQSRDHRHLWVNVASAGGALDRWGEQPQADYEEFVVSQDEYGFVLLEVTAGDDPSFRLRRVSRGVPELVRDNDETDGIFVRRFNSAPARPRVRTTAPADVPAECIWLAATSFRDPDGDALTAAHWQIATACEPFDEIVYDAWRQDRNEYNGFDTQAGDLLDDERVARLDAGSYCWRVRYRDEGLAWSPWSNPTPLTIGAADYGTNLLTNPGAEDGLDGWEVVTGIVEALADGECDGREPRSGERYFVAGGLCESAALGEARQLVDLTEEAGAVDLGERQVRFGGYVSDDSGNDEPGLYVTFHDEEGEAMEASETVGIRRVDWTRVEGVAAIPPGTRQLGLTITGARRSGTDNNSYLDDLFLLVEDTSACQAPAPDTGGPPVDDASEGAPDMGGDVATADTGRRDIEDGGDASEDESSASDLGFDLGTDGDEEAEEGSESGEEAQIGGGGCGGCATARASSRRGGLGLLLLGVAFYSATRRKRPAQ